MNWQAAWAVKSKLTLIQAAYLICGYDPSNIDPSNVQKEIKAPLPEGVYPILMELTEYHKGVRMQLVESLDLIVDEFFKSQSFYDSISAISVKEWLISVNLRPKVFFPDNMPDGYRPYLDKTHSHYSKKLAASVLAWEALAKDPSMLDGRTPKSGAIYWINKNQSALGFSNREGTVPDATLDQMGRVVNWSEEGGSAKTKMKKK